MKQEMKNRRKGRQRKKENKPSRLNWIWLRLMVKGNWVGIDRDEVEAKGCKPHRCGRIEIQKRN